VWGLVKKILTVCGLLMVLGLFLFPAGCSRALITEELLLTYKVRPGTVLEIYNPNGAITVSGWDGTEMEIKAVKETYHGQAALDKVDIFIDIAQKMVIQTEQPADIKNVIVSYEIKVPEDILIGVIESFNGNINLQDVQGDPELSTSNGTITVNNVKGLVSAQSNNGDLHLAQVSGLAFLKTLNGSINAALHDFQEDLEITTHNGSINLFIDPTLALDLKAKTQNGEIKYSNLDIDIVFLEQTTLIGEMNGGGKKINISTSNGSIELTQLR